MSRVDSGMPFRQLVSPACSMTMNHNANRKHLALAKEKAEEAEDAASAASSTSSSLERARGHLERAEKKTRPTVRRWKPKMKVAGDEFCKAAVLFYRNGDTGEAKEMMLRASECYAKKRAWHSAAKTLEQAMAIDQKKVRGEGRNWLNF